MIILHMYVPTYVHEVQFVTDFKGDQMSFEKVTQNVDQPFFGQN
jgi:hypothetical protein